MAGVAAGLARYLGVEPVVVRVAFVVLALSGGTGVALYIVGWLLMPPAPGAGHSEEESLVQAALRRGDPAQVLSVGAIVLGVLLLVRQTGLWFDDRVVWPAALVAAGLGLAWHQARPGPLLPSRLSPLTLGRAPALRVAAGVALVAAGAALFVAFNRSLDAAREGLFAGTVVLAGVLVIFGPWWWRLGREYAAERTRRIREQERAEVAAHIHDSVLQTLALIQRHGDDPQAMVRLARRQERELRQWLYAGERPATPAGTLGAALRAIAAEVEDDHGVTVEVVVVGDRGLDEALDALVRAAREAMVNAARWSGAPRISVYAECAGDTASVFVRDEGSGFDLEAVGPEHRGISDSIVGRMERHGGRAVVRSEPGSGTEVELTLRCAPAPLGNGRR